MLTVYNTLTRRKEKFKPLKDKKVTFYHCGPTLYWTQHLGNLRAVVLADLIRRGLEYLGYQVKMARNYTDVGHLASDQDQGEDKIERSARREKKSPKEIVKKFLKIFENDLKELNVIPPEKKPFASGEIKGIQKMIKILLDKGYAYQTDLAIYFQVSKAKDYYRLSGQKGEKNISRAGKGEVGDSQKKSPADFALWFFKAGVHQKALQTWPSPFYSRLVEDGRGFPGWHIECSVMAQKYLGETIDIHMGGVEHIPIHHTNEIAQSEAASGKKFVNYWLHNEHLTVNGKKISKSQGTSYSLEDVKQRGFSPLALRYFFLQAHYRSRQNLTWSALKGAEKGLTGLQVQFEPPAGSFSGGRPEKKFLEKFRAALEDDFNIPRALATGREVLKSDLPGQVKLATLKDFDRVFGLGLGETKFEKIPEKIKKLGELRWKKKKAGDYREADRLRKEIGRLGYQVEDGVGDYLLKKNNFQERE